MLNKLVWANCIMCLLFMYHHVSMKEKYDTRINILLDSGKILKEEYLDLHKKYKEVKELNKDYRKIIKDLRSMKQGGINKRQLDTVVKCTLSYLGEKDIDSWSNLILITIATESDMGRLLKQQGGIAQGITQVEPSTEKYVLKYLKQNKPKEYDTLVNIKSNANLGIHEAQYNLAYSISLTYWVYKIRKVNPKDKSLEELCKIHKKYYNTYLGKATPRRTMQKLIAYGW